MNLDEFCRMLAIVNEREAFGRAEFDRVSLPSCPELHAYAGISSDFTGNGASET